MWPDDPDRGDRLVIFRQLHLETPVLLEREPLPVGPVSSVATGLLRELGTVDAGIDGHRLPGGRASYDSRVDRHGDGHLMGRQRHRVVLHTTLVAKNHLPILRACSIRDRNRFDIRRRLAKDEAMFRARRGGLGLGLGGPEAGRGGTRHPL